MQMSKDQKVTVIITAAGSGTRFGTGQKKSLPKQFQKLLGKPVILHSLLIFQKARVVDEIIISADKKYFALLHELALKNKISKLTSLVEGGKTRFQSVKNAFLQVNSAKHDIILIHDAARPKMSGKLVAALVKETAKHPGVIPACPVSETLKLAKKNIVTRTVDRSSLWLVQTPQAFRYHILDKSYKKAGSRKTFTDEASLVENGGFKVRLITGSKENIKITTKEDLDLLKRLMK
jgi:2-C-methyl-D-erythritol 4-phosphate cytidylyltransferase